MQVNKTNTKQSFGMAAIINPSGMNKEEKLIFKTIRPQVNKIAKNFDLEISKGIRIVNKLSQEEIECMTLSKDATKRVEEFKEMYGGLIEVQEGYMLLPSKLTKTLLSKAREILFPSKYEDYFVKRMDGETVEDFENDLIDFTTQIKEDFFSKT